MENKKLPTLSELSGDLQAAFENDQLNLLLNQPPIDKWIKKHPFVNIKNAVGQFEPLQYLPIDKVELLLTKIFQEWKAEVISFHQLFNSVAVHIRLHYKNPVTLQWHYHDGVGAVGVQTDAGKSASDLSAIKQDAVMKALPAAKSYAIKDAADHLGAIFGRDLNKIDITVFAGSYKHVDSGEYEKIQEQLDLISTLGEHSKYWEQMPELHRDKKVQQMFQESKNKILKPNK